MKTALQQSQKFPPIKWLIAQSYRRNFHHISDNRIHGRVCPNPVSSVVFLSAFRPSLGRLKTLNRKAVKQTHESNTDA